MLKLFSTLIAVGDFDPTADVLPQLQALDDRQPHPGLQYWEVKERIAKMLAEVTVQDDKRSTTVCVLQLRQISPSTPETNYP